MHIGMTYDLRAEYLQQGYGMEETAEFDRAETIDAIAGVLARLGHEVERIGNVRALAARLAGGARYDLVFNIAEGLRGYGREAQVPALLDAYGIPYTFCDPLVACLSLHKGMTKRVLHALGIETPRFAVVEEESDIAAIDLPFPLFAKPVAEGTSKGCDARSIVTTRGQLRRTCRRLLARYRQPVLVEAYLPGREFTVGMLGTGAAARAVGALEVVLLSRAEPGVYSYENKERSEELVEYRLADDPAAREARALALRCWQRLGGRDAGRVDLRCDEAGRPLVLEVNPLPGMHPQHSDLPMLCGLAGIGYEALVGEIVASAATRIASDGAPVAA